VLLPPLVSVTVRAAVLGGVHVHDCLWYTGGVRCRGLRRLQGQPPLTVVLKGMFTRDEVVADPALPEELEADVAAECAKMGQLEKVKVPDLCFLTKLIVGLGQCTADC